MFNRAIQGTAVTVLLLGLLASGCAMSSAEITTGTLLEQMSDLSRLAELPEPPYSTKQFSSYDRKSVSPADHEAWFANSDYNQYIRTEETDGRKEHVMMDAAGPGAIVRIWSANPKGVLRVYLDGDKTPALTASMPDLLSGKVAGFPEPLAGVASRGWNLYFPIPYAKHCKVTNDEGGFYYLVNYRTYPAGTPVRTFTREDVTAWAPQATAVAAQLADPAQATKPDAARTTEHIYKAQVPAGEEVLLASFATTDGHAICRFDVNLTAADAIPAARALILVMTFDGQQTVECPIGDFFGTAPGMNPYQGLPLGVGKAQDRLPLYCRWLMPYSRSAKITLKNLGSQTAHVGAVINTAPYQWTRRSLLFHAGWRIERDLPTRPFTDWTHLEVKGHGRFVGGALHVANPVRQWWGEGDEKIYVDGEAFPSHFGTGSEDYYGYAWCSPDLFTHAYHNQPRCDGPGNYGHTSVNRFHIMDDIPFARSFKFDMENWHSHGETQTTRAAVSYWYARPGGSSFFKTITAADIVLPVVPEYVIPHVEGAIEGEKMKIIAHTGKAHPQDLGDKCSASEHLWWTGGKPGDKLTLGFEVPEAGQRNVIAQFVKARDYGIVQVYINDQKAGQPIDLFNPSIVNSGEIDLGAFNLNKGENRITLEIVGANEKAEKAYMCGLDYLRLK